MWLFAIICDHSSPFWGPTGHPSCLDMSEDLVCVIQTYRWQCMECKTCTVCQQPHHEDEMMFCDQCDRGYHTFCVGMNAIPLGTCTSSRDCHTRRPSLYGSYRFIYCWSTKNAFADPAWRSNPVVLPLKKWTCVLLRPFHLRSLGVQAMWEKPCHA